MSTATLNSPISADRVRPSRLSMALAFFAIYVVWGTTYLAIRYAVETIPPLVTAGLRHTTAGLILLAIAWSRGFRPRREHWIAGAVLGALFFLIGHGTLHWAEQYVASGLAALLVASEPLWILLLGAAMGQQRINWKNGLGLLMGLAGVGILTAREFTTRSSLTIGVIAIVVGAASWAVGVCVSPKLRLPRDPIGRTAVPVLCGAVMLLIAAAASGEFSAVHWSGVTLRSWLGLAYLIVFGSIIAFTAYTWLLQHCSPTLVATHTFVNPLVAVVMGWLWASEAISVRIVVATVVILGAIVLIQRGDRHAELQAEAVQSD
ncbi:MAG TPA: EamA family transporter [Terriglobales bacterium]|jgi:drug/metabolite transporter (DMT)-like permease|nr:EamA family transporter [Terriglobales bacterium]